MKLATIFTIILVVTVSLSPAATVTELPYDNAIVSFRSPTGEALLWLSEQQQKDGSFGEGENKIILTSLAVLTYLDREEVPNSSEKYSDTVIKALKQLTKLSETKKTFSNEEHALLTWCFSETYDHTRNPICLKTLRKHAAFIRTAHTTPWHILAVGSLRLNWFAKTKKIADNAVAESLKIYPEQTNNLLCTFFMPLYPSAAAYQLNIQ